MGVYSHMLLILCVGHGAVAIWFAVCVAIATALWMAHQYWRIFVQNCITQMFKLYR